MSNTLRFDPLLVRYLARELDQRLRGRACAAAPLFASDRSVLLVLDQNQALQMDLHPTRGWVRLVPWEEPSDELDALCMDVTAPADERLLEIRLRVGDRFRVMERRLVVELHTNQWNALLVGEDGRVVSALRARNSGARVLRPGQPYQPPPDPGRFGAGPVDEGEARRRWSDALSDVGGPELRAALLGAFAYTGAPNAEWILGDRADGGGPDLPSAFERWWWLRGLPPALPALLHGPAGDFPYPLPLAGVAGEPIPSLLDGMERVAAAVPGERGADLLQEERERWVARRGAAAERRVRRLEAQETSGEEVERLRGSADLLLANYHRVTRGAAEVRLDDWDGNPVEIRLDPALSPSENAARLYDEARKRERAAARLPELLAAARAELARWQEAGRLLSTGELPAWVAREMERAEGSAEGSPTAGEAAETRPYRVYRTSGRLEVRVGKSARDNDRLTFGHARPNDVWLHARSVSGSHVILRWDDDSAPPARDLEEAATLAAMYSKARTSSLVPVDWTRRKHVRKPRGSPPGAVIPNRVKTVFVEPDGSLEERLREGSGSE